MATIVTALMLMLGIGFLGTWIAARFRIPHSVFLVVLGLTSGMLIRGHSGGMETSISYLTQLFPDLILYVLLPPLIFESAYQLDFERLRRDFFPLTGLSVVVLIISTALIGLSLHWMFQLELIPSLVFGALISATDPVAVVALFKETGAPVRLSTLIEGESLLNDGTAIVLFRVLLAAAASKQSASHILIHGMTQFFAVILGGAAVGLATAWLTRGFLKLTSRSGSSQLGITVVSAYLSFIAADRFLGASGVISTLVVGLYLGRRARLELNRDAVEGMKHIWEFLSLAANTLVFLAVGLVVDPSLLLNHFALIPLTVGIAYLARALSIFTTIPLVNALRLAKPISFTFQVILFWGGIRGGLALGLVLLLPDGFPHKQLFVALAIAVVISNLVVNALTTKKVLRILGLDRLDQAEERFYKNTLELAQISAFSPLLAAAASGGLSPTLVENQRNRSIEALKKDRETYPARRDEDHLFRFEVSSMLLNERRIYDLRLQDAVLSRDAYLELSRIVASRFEIFNQDGLTGLERFSFDLESTHETGIVRGVLRHFPINHSRRMLRRLTIRLEVLLHLKFGLEEASTGPLPTRISLLAAQWSQQADLGIQAFYRAYPHYGSAVQSFFIANTICARSHKVIQQLSDATIIGGTVRAKAEHQVSAAHVLALLEANQLMRPTRAYLVGRVPLFNQLPKLAIKKIAEFSKIIVLEAGDIVFKEGDKGQSFFLVAAGLLVVNHSRITEGESSPRLFTGDFFGEMSLLFGQSRMATVTAVMTTELLELDQKTFEFILGEYPILKKTIYELAELRRKQLAPTSAEPSLKSRSFDT